jgi:hypothetical protein
VEDNSCYGILEESSYLNENVEFQIKRNTGNFKNRTINIEALLLVGIRYRVEDSTSKEDSGIETKSSAYIINEKNITKIC